MVYIVIRRTVDISIKYSKTANQKKIIIKDWRERDINLKK